MTSLRNVGVFTGKEGLARKWPEPGERRVTGLGWVRLQSRLESNDPHGGQGLVWVRDMACVGVKHRTAEVRLCYRWLSPFIKLV